MIVFFKSDVRSLVDEVACLHESLMKVREELRREKQKNTLPTRDRKASFKYLVQALSHHLLK